ncbi:MAG: hypothetical protein AAGA48_13125 [Myxococcota bacterium]
MPAFDALDAVLDRLAAASWKERESIKEELVALGQQFDDVSTVLSHLEMKSRAIDDLELRWEVEAVIETLTPPEPDPEPEPEAEKAPEGPLQPGDLDMVYEDPRGLILYKSKVGERWFATQRDPRTGQPQTFELRPSEIQQLKMQLMGSPYWVTGTSA